MKMFGIRSATLHSRAEVRVIQPTSPHGSNSIQNFLFLERPVERQPFFEQRGDTIRQTQRDTACRLAQRSGATVIATVAWRQAQDALDQLLALQSRGVSPDEIAATARETVRLAVAAQRLAEDRALNAFESTGKAREEETAWARSARKIDE